MNYYDGTKLLSLKDITGERPEIYICTTNRSAGKTTYFNRWRVNRFLKHNEKTLWLFRNKYETDGDMTEKIFKDVSTLFFPTLEFTEKRYGKSGIKELFCDGVSIGYVTSIRNSDNVKKHSHLLSDTDCIIFDEFMPEDNGYLPDETERFISIHTSIGRGHGEQVRRVPVIMISNPVTVFNPYYSEMKITERLKKDTVFLRGDGYVLEQGFYSDVAEKQKTGGFNRAFSDNRYLNFVTELTYLNDTDRNIRPLPVSERGRYICTITDEKEDHYAVVQYRDGYWLKKGGDESFITEIMVNTENRTLNRQANTRRWMTGTLREIFMAGRLYFTDIRCKNILYALLSL